MSRYLLSIVAAVFMGIGFMSTSALSAERVYEKGSVWAVSFAKTKPGKYNDYLADLNSLWRKGMEAGMKSGDILSYKIMNVASPRKGESNLVLMVEYKNWATFDRSDDYMDKMTKKLQGSLSKAAQATVDRGALRTLNGGILLQEVKFKK